MDNRFDGFAVNIYLDDEGAWLAHFVELPEVSAFGDTSEVALNELASAWDAVKATYQDEGLPGAGGAAHERTIQGRLTSASIRVCIEHWRSRPPAWAFHLTLSWPRSYLKLRDPFSDPQTHRGCNKSKPRFPTRRRGFSCAPSMGALLWVKVPP